MKTNLILLFLAVFFVKTANAQISTDDNSTRTVTVISYDAKDYNKKKVENKNAFKVGILDVLYGHQSVYYERGFNKIFSLQVGFGIAHRNFYEDLSAMIRDDLNYYDANFERYSLDEITDYRDTRKVRLGYAVSLNPRVYTNGWGMEGFYVGPSIRYQQNNYKYIKGGLDENEFSKKFSIGFVIGGQSNNKPICVDYGIGIGYKKLSQSRYLTGDYYDENSFKPGIYTFKSKGVNFEFYLNIGGFFSGSKKKEK